MDLSTAQKATLKAAIQANSALNQLYVDGDLGGLANALNAAASPAYIVWRTDVTADETGNAWSGTDIDGMSALNMQRLQLLLASSPQGVFDMSRPDRRAGFENPFGTNQNNASRVAMRAVWKRSASVLEKVFATGSGTDNTPSTMAVVGSIGWMDLIGL